MRSDLLISFRFGYDLVDIADSGRWDLLVLYRKRNCEGPRPDGPTRGEGSGPRERYTGDDESQWGLAPYSQIQTPHTYFPIPLKTAKVRSSQFMFAND